MKTAMQGVPESTMARPNGIVSIRINPRTGERARPGEDGTFEIFKEEDAPAPLSQDTNGNGSGANDSDSLPGQIF